MYCTIHNTADTFSCWQLSTHAFHGCMSDMFPFCICYTGFPQYLLFRTLGLCLALADPPAEHRLQILNDVWRVVSCLTNAGHYVSCAEVWVQFAVRHFSVCESD